MIDQHDVPQSSVRSPSARKSRLQACTGGDPEHRAGLEREDLRIRREHDEVRGRDPEIPGPEMHRMPDSQPRATMVGDALLVTAWHVTDGEQDGFVEILEGLYEQMRTMDGFVEGAILRGVNPTRYISYVRLRSAEDRRRLREEDQVLAALRALAPIARAELHSYDRLRSFAPAARGDLADRANGRS
jgi:heme-degrading monooxygenase HmoA